MKIEELKSFVREGCKNKLKSFSFHPKMLDVLGSYNSATFKNDLMAGIVVGIVALPLGIAFGIASGVTPEKGIIATVIAGIIVAVLGGTKVQIAGPTGTFIVVVYGVVQEYGLTGLAVTGVLAGLFLILLGVLKLGIVIKYIPYPIVVGFMGGIAVTMFSTQVKDFLGLSMESVPTDFIEKWIAYAKSFHTIDLWTAGIGLLSVLIIIYAPKISKKIPGSLLAIVLSTLIVLALKHFAGITSIETIGDRFSIDNRFSSAELPDMPWSIIKKVASPAFTIAILGAIEALLSATIADGITGDRHDSNTELIAQGIANLVTPLFGGIPTTGAIARTMTNVNNGGSTPIAGVIHAIVLAIIFLFLMPFAKYIPMTCLAAVLFVVAYNMCGWRSFKILLTNPKEDIIVLFLTFFLSVIFDLSIAIEVGIAMSCFLFMSRMMKNTDIRFISSYLEDENEEVDSVDETLDRLTVPHGIEVYDINGPFFFGLGNRFEEVMNSVRGRKPYVRIIRMQRVPFIDATGLGNLYNMCMLSKNNGIEVLLSGVKEEVLETIKKSPLYGVVGEKGICRHVNEALILAKEIKEKKDKE